ncbi:MAG: ATP-binding cassette domain-containing protein [Planctomycetota bacterium]|nr:ATP-binding cassette domain-containing protein [Planctomycetota bacterium]
MNSPTARTIYTHGPAIEAKHLGRNYQVVDKKAGLFAAMKGLWSRPSRTVQAVRDVSFRIEPGEMVAFLGPNGAGKTTTLKMLAGLIYPSSGTATVLGFLPWERHDAFRRQFSLVMGQKNQLWWDLPAGDSFELHREIYSLSRERYQHTLGELVEMFGVESLTRQPVRELSLGERMKMELIASLLHEPRVLLLDEPTIGLDVLAQRTIQRCLKEYNERKGATIILTSHYMRDVEALCSRVLMIVSGMLQYDGPLKGLLDRFGRTKLIRLQFEGIIPNGLDRLGECRVDGPVVELRVDKSLVAQALGHVVDEPGLIDLSVQDPPLEDVVAKAFGGHESVSGKRVENL